VQGYLLRVMSAENQYLLLIILLSESDISSGET
jgi:hypothetical protein